MANHDNDIDLTMGMTADDVKATVTELQSKFKDLSKLDFGKNLSKSFDKVLQSMKDTGKQTSEIMSELKKLETPRPTTAYSNLEKEVSGLLTKQEELNEKFKQANAVRISTGDRLKLIREEVAAKNEQIKQQNELIRLENAQRTGSRKLKEKPLIDYKQLAEYKQTLHDYRSANMSAMNYQKTLERVSSRIEEVDNKMKEMELAGTHVFDGVGTVQYNMYIEQLRELSDELTKYVNIVDYAANSPSFTPDTATSKWQSFMAVLRETHPTLASIGSSVGQLAQIIVDNFDDATTRLKTGFMNA